MNIGILVKGRRIDTGEWVRGVPESKKEFNPCSGQLRDQAPEWHHYLFTHEGRVEVEAIKFMVEDENRMNPICKTTNLECAGCNPVCSHREELQELKPCPFCGGKAIISMIPPLAHIKGVWKPGTDYPERVFVECTSCTCSISGETDQEARSNWNERKD